MATIWALVANTGGAQIFEIKGLGKSIVKVQHIPNPEGRKRGGDVYSDRPGRAFDRQGGARHALQTATDLHLHEIQIFAKKLMEILIRGYEEKSYDQLALVCPPQFLGEINQLIPDHLKKCILKEIHKDLPDSLSDQDIIKHLDEYLNLWNK